MPGQIKTIYSDSNKQNAVLPRTKVNAITDSEGNSLQSLLDDKIETVKVNGTALIPDAQKAVDVEVPIYTDLVTEGVNIKKGQSSTDSQIIFENDTNGVAISYFNDDTYVFSKVVPDKYYVDARDSKIDVIKVNGTTQTITNKEVDLTVPTKTSDLTNDGDDGTNAFVAADDIATDSAYGLVKTNSSESITLNSNGQLDVGGRLGQFPSTTGVYSPKSINPNNVGNGSFLLTEASGTNLGNKSLAVSTGTNITLKTAAAAGSTQYVVANNYANRIICAGAVGGIVALNESSAATTFVNITSVQINGSSYVPDSSPNSSTNNIIIKTDASINPNSSVSSIRVYSNEGTGFSNLFVGQAVGGVGGASIVVGQKVYSSSGNACALVGADIYNAGNGSAIFGRQHINRKNRVFLAGTGHDTTNARSESVSALGEWSDLSSTETLFAIGDGTDHTARSNAFEVRDQCIVLKSPNGTKWKITVDNNGTLTTAAI